METMARQHSDAQAEILIWALCHVYICNQSLHAGWLVLDSSNNALWIYVFFMFWNKSNYYAVHLVSVVEGIWLRPQCAFKYRLNIRVPFASRATRELRCAMSWLDSCMARKGTNFLMSIALLIQNTSLLTDPSTSLLSPRKKLTFESRRRKKMCKTEERPCSDTSVEAMECQKLNKCMCQRVTILQNVGLTLSICHGPLRCMAGLTSTLALSSKHIVEDPWKNHSSAYRAHVWCSVSYWMTCCIYLSLISYTVCVLFPGDFRRHSEDFSSGVKLPLQQLGQADFYCRSTKQIEKLQ